MSISESLMERPSANTLSTSPNDPSGASDLSDDDYSFRDDESITAVPSAGDPGSSHTQGSSGFTGQVSQQWRGITRRLQSWLLRRPMNYQEVRSSSHEAPLLASQSEPSGRPTEIFRSMLLSSWLNVLLIFVPFGFVTYLFKASPVLVFFTNSFAIIPLSALLTEATERIAHDAGDTIGAMLNISLGNLVELILFVALKNDQIRIVQASILGSILVNILLILGSALLACSFVDVKTVYSTKGTQLLGSLLFVSVFAFLMPTAFDYTFKDTDKSGTAILQMSRLSALVVLAIYVLYFVHELKPKTPHHDGPAIETAELSASSSEDASNSRHSHPRTIRFADDEVRQTAAHSHSHSRSDPAIELGDMEGGHSKEVDVEVNDHRRSAEASRTPARSAYQRRHSSSITGGSLGLDGRRVVVRAAVPTLHLARTSYEELRPPSRQGLQVAPSADIVRTNRIVSILVLIMTSGIMSICAEFLVSTIDEVTHAGHLSESLIGLIILPIVGNMAEYITVVTVAVKEKLDLAIAVSVGSSIQIALCVTPLTVIAGWIMNKDLVLTFTFFEMATLVGTVLLVNLIILSEGGSGPRSGALRGALICGCYAIITIGAYLSPEE